MCLRADSHNNVNINIMRFANGVSQLLLSTEAVRLRALNLLAGVEPKGKSEAWQETMFHSHYGSPSKVVASMWFELCTTDNEKIKLKPSEMTARGFRGYMMAHFFLWQNPKNAVTFGFRFGVCERLARGYPIWKWVDRLAALSELVIFWHHKDLDSVNTAKRILSVDGVDFRTWEQNHERYNMDRTDCSHKHNHGAAKYELGIHAFKSQLVWINGPHPGGKHDLDIFRQGLKQKLKPWKKAIGNQGYRSKEEVRSQDCKC